jgi:hypothetical protein
MAFSPEQAKLKYNNNDSYELRQYTKELDELEIRIDEELVNSGGVGCEIAFAPHYLIDVAQRRYPGWKITIVPDRWSDKRSKKGFRGHLKFEVPPGGPSDA